MNENMNKKIESVLSGMNISDLKKLAQNPAVKNIVGNLSEKDKQKLMREFSSLNNAEIERKLKNADFSKMSDMSADELIRKLKNL